MRRVVLTTLTMLVAVSVAAASILGAVRLWTATDSLPGMSRDTRVMSGTVESGPTDIQLSATLPLSSSQGGVINAPSWAGGTVTWVSRKKTLTNGADVVEVNGERSILCAGKTPYYRPLRLGDKGPDVSAVRVCLGFSASGPVTRDLLEALAAKLDLLDPRTGRLPRLVTELPTSRLVWAPNAPLTVERWLAIVGSQAPAAGTPLAKLTKGTRVGRVTVAGMSAADLTSVLDAATSRTFSAGPVAAEVTEDLKVQAGGADWEMVLSAAAAEATAGQAPDPAGDADTSWVPSEMTLKGALSLSFERTAVVANSALYTGSDGQVCLAVKQGQLWTASRVAAVSFGWGQSIVDPDLLGKVVALNPQALGAARPMCSA